MSQPRHGWDMDPPIASEGSVRRARERAQGRPTVSLPQPQYPPSAAGGDSSPKGHLSPPPRSHVPPPRPPSQSLSQPPSLPPSLPPSQPPPLTPSSPSSPSARLRTAPSGSGRRGPTISRPTHLAQRPAPSAPPVPPVPPPPGSPWRSGNPSEPPRSSPARPLRPPPRPARPSESHWMADQTQPQGPTPVFMSRRHDWDDVVEHSEEPQPMPVTTPVTPSSRYTASSFGSIPEFPAPASEPAQPATAVPRRSSVSGPPSSRRGASSHYSTASNVSPIPEESSRSHESYASSSAMPGHWSPSSFRTISPAHGEPTYGDSPTEQGRESVAEDYGDESKLVRSASIGKKGRAALVHNRPGPSASAQAKPPPNPVPAIHGPFQSGTGYVEEGSGSSSNTAATVKRAKTEDDTSEQGKQYLVPLGLQDSTVPESEVPPVPPLRHSSSRLSTMKRPPRLDMEAVRSAEARGSMTSLPDLIKRATRLAAMIDTGKRPASRFDNLEDFLDKPALRERGKEAYSGRHPSGFSDMLAAFPSPAQVTPRDQKPRVSWFPKTTSWPLAPSRLRAAGEDESEDRDIDEKLASGEGQPKRRCCGMPPWLCVLVILLILAIIVVAVVIPLQYFVLKNLGNHSVAPTASETCQDTLKCRNGGTNIVSQGTCSCICTNGFTGRDCGTAGSEGCSTTNLISSNSSPDITNVTVGSAIPRLIVDAQANFSIPLSGMEILAQINRGNLSCRAQNSLVTFEGRSMRTGQEGSDVSEMMDSAVAVATNDYSSPVPHTEKELDSNFTVTEDVLDFARVAVLYVLQSDGYNDASSAQTSIGSFFSRVDSDGGLVTNRQAQNITMDSDNTVDLVDLRVDLGNGVVGGS